MDYLLKQFDKDEDKDAVHDAFDDLPLDLVFLRRYTAEQLSKEFNFSVHIAPDILSYIELYCAYCRSKLSVAYNP